MRHARTVAGASLQARPVAVPLLIGLNLGIFLITVAQAGSIGRNFASPLFFDWVTWPAAIVDGNEWWRLITGGFLHYGLVHVALNMIGLWFLGRLMEPLLGWARFTVVYLLSLLGGSAAVFAFGDVNAGVAGASGAVFGLLGAALVAVIRLKWNPQPILMMIALNAVISFLPGISLLGHLGGFVVGAGLTAAMMYAPRDRRALIQGAAVAGVLVLLVLVIALRTAQFSSVLAL